MKKSLIARLSASALVGVALLAGAVHDGAAAQKRKDPVILVVDRARLVAESKAGQSIPDQAKAVQASVRAELESEAKKLQTDIEKYQKNASLMSDEVRQKTEQELAARQQVILPRQAQIMEQAFAAVVDNAQAQILLAARPILKEIVDDRGATILLDRAAVMYASPDTDVTQEVLKDLDKELKTVEVERISLADVMKRLEEAQTQPRQQN